jgi:hypothetical protein
LNDNFSIKISQLADDTTLYFNSKNDISVAMNEIEIFGNFSGLMINKVVKINVHSGESNAFFKSTKTIAPSTL